MKMWWVRCLLLVGLGTTSCVEEPTFTEPVVLGGIEVAPEVLEQGKRVYSRYCVTCHGTIGDGKGVASYGQWPPPRDFRSGQFKFAGVRDRGIPSDSELRRIITQGLDGTYMRPWVLRDSELNSVIQYLKTFSQEGKGFRSKRLKVKSPDFPPDPYQGAKQVADAIAEGEKLYHAEFQCSSCHPAYLPPEKLSAWDVSLRPDAPYDSVPKYSENYRSVLLPPDFLRHRMRAVRWHTANGKRQHRLSDIYRAVAYGLMGPMPGYVHLGESKVWAVAHYVKSLADKRDSADADVLRKRLLRSR